MLYRIIRFFIWILFLILGLKVKGSRHIPARGRVLIVANHNSNWDPVLIAAAVWRPICYMAKSSLFKYAWSAKILRALNAFPVNRDGVDRQAMRDAQKILESEMILGIFPEGTRKNLGEPIKAKKGAALLAVRGKSPIVPIACIGARSILPVGWFRKLTVVIGEPIYNEDIEYGRVSSDGLKNLSDVLSTNIQELYDKEAGIK
ncbi:MAG: 1-acyl-sn-glycerol-3-phosphate acyltransferase [Syntrophomonadaceae bacterium]|jgi:1-acyl-sn-glycerol-3-phosphate acyltransferase|nr:1-acyl-sn-glycerol-3-phosphate acyltransferase [Syntrophomonadaceae bacterium]